jgi:PhnB protein
LFVDGATAAIDFYCNVLGASQRGDVMVGPDGRVGHCELQIGDSVLMLSDEHAEMNALGPVRLGGSPVMLHLYVEDVDAVFAAALAAGATEERPLTDQFYGDRSGLFVDPWGHRWDVSSHIEDVAPDEMARRAAETMGG